MPDPGTLAQPDPKPSVECPKHGLSPAWPASSAPTCSKPCSGSTKTVVGLDNFATGHRRYFNVFGPRQDPAGAYAAVIPKWTAALLAGADVFINGDGETSRDFCYIDNTVQANLLAATVVNPAAINQVYNVAVGERTTLNALFQAIRETLAPRFPHLREVQPRYRDFRPGDVRHSLADIDKARTRLGYAPGHRLGDGLAEAMDWYVEDLGGNHAH